MSPPGPGEPVVADLRSDTLTRPTQAMREAMVGATVGDDVYAEDPTVAALEERVAALLGHEAALFTPTGSMANVLGVAALVPPGAELLCDSLAHVVRAELGAHGALSGITTRTWTSSRGLLDDAALDAVAALMAPDAGPYLVSTAAVAVEDTHNFGGGTVQDLSALERVRALTADVGVAVHLDGARLWNAAVADPLPTDEALLAAGRCADTVAVCLSKGLGAPVGSLVVSSAGRIGAARVRRKRLGGGMRQTGMLAAAGLHALDHHLERLAEDHGRARRLAQAAAGALPGCVDPALVETNIVAITVPDAPALVAAAAQHGVALSAVGPRTARAVTHLDVDDDATEQAAQVLTEVLPQLG